MKGKSNTRTEQHDDYRLLPLSARTRTDLDEFKRDGERDDGAARRLLDETTDT